MMPDYPQDVEGQSLWWEYHQWRYQRGLMPTPEETCRFALWQRRLEQSVGAGFLALPSGKAESER